MAKGWQLGERTAFPEAWGRCRAVLTPPLGPMPVPVPAQLLSVEGVTVFSKRSIRLHYGVP